MMAGDRFVVDRAFQAKLRHVADAAGILEYPRPRTIRGRTVVTGGRRILYKRREWLCHNLRFRANIEQERRASLRIAENGIDVAHDQGAALFRTRIGII